MLLHYYHHSNTTVRGLLPFVLPPQLLWKELGGGSSREGEVIMEAPPLNQSEYGHSTTVLNSRMSQILCMY